MGRDVRVLLCQQHARPGLRALPRAGRDRPVQRPKFWRLRVCARGRAAAAHAALLGRRARQQGEPSALPRTGDLYRAQRHARFSGQVRRGVDARGCFQGPALRPWDALGALVEHHASGRGPLLPFQPQQHRPAVERAVAGAVRGAAAVQLGDAVARVHG